MDNSNGLNAAVAPRSRKAGRRVMWLAVAASVAVFAVSAVFAGANASGYERLKNAFFTLIESMNGPKKDGAITVTQTVYIDGEVASVQRDVDMRNESRNLLFETNYVSEEWDNLNNFPRYRNYSGEDASYPKVSESMTYRDDTAWYEWDNGEFRDRSGWRSVPDFYAEYDSGADDRYAQEAEAETAAQRRLVGAIMDALVGDTRNYFISDGNRVSVALRDGQIPELAQYALAALTEQYNNISRNAYAYEYDGHAYGETAAVGVIGSPDGGAYSPTADEIIGADAHFTYGALDVTLDDAGAAVKAEAEVVIESTVNGAPKEYRMVVTLESGDAGSAAFETPAPSSYEPTGELPALLN